MGVLNVGISGLRVSQAGLLTTSHNIANSSTAGYSRQEIQQTTAFSNFAGYGFVGQGANIASVRRVYSEYLTNQILDAESNVGELDMYLSQAQQIDNLLADESAGLSPALSDFFKATQEFAADPSSIPARQSMLSSSQSLVARFQALDQRLTEMRQGVNTQLKSEVSLLNTYATEIAELNDKIVRATAVAQGQPPNDLLDQRDQLIREINKKIQVSVVEDTGGSYNVYVGTGQPLVVGTKSYQFIADTVSSEDPERVVVSMFSPNGNRIELAETLLQGGELGGLLKFRRETLDVTQNALGKVALSVATTVNAQHKMGIDLAGAFGKDIFSVAQPTVLPNNANSGTGTLTARIVDSDYRLDLGAGTITRLSDGAVTGFTGFPAVVDGVTIDLSSGAVGGSDVFIIKPGNALGERVFAQSDNTGDAVLTSSGSNLQGLPSISSDYRLTVTTTGLRLERLTDGRTWSGNDMTDLQAKLAADPQGFLLDWDGGVAGLPGDTFLIQPTRNAAKTLAIMLSDPMNLAAAAPFTTSSALSNEGTGKISTGSVLALDPNGVPLAGTVTITYDAASSSLVLSGGINTTIPNFIPGQDNKIMVNGLSFTMSGIPADGDIFTLEINRNGVADNRNAMALGALQTAAVMNNGSATYQSAYSQIVSFVGNKTREVEVTGKAQQTLADHAETSRQEISGVNLDEEAANLLKYQQAYQASARIMQIAGEMFDELLSLGR